MSPGTRRVPYRPLVAEATLQGSSMRSRIAGSSLVALLATATAVAGQAAPDATTDSGAITLERIMAHPDWLGRAPERPYWADDGRSVYYFRSEPVVDGFDPRDHELYQADLTGDVLRRVEPEHYPDVDIAGGVYDRDRQHKAFERAGDIYVKDLTTGSVRQLMRTSAAERAPFFLADGRVGWIRDHQVFARDPATGLDEQLFDLRAEKDPLETREKERLEADYLRQQQDRLFDWIRHEDRRAEQRLRRERERQLEDPARSDPPVYLGDKVKIENVFPSPDGHRALVTTSVKVDKPPIREKMPQYVTATGWVETRDVRPKAGSAPSAERLWLIDRASGEIRDVSFEALPGITEDPLAELRAVAKERARERKQALGAERADTESSAKPEADERPEPREVRVVQAIWSPSGERVVLDLNSLDNKDRWLATLDAGGKALASLQRQHDPAWIAWGFRDLGWLRDEERIYFLSEETGWSQLYVMGVAGKEPGQTRRLTCGDFVVDSPTLSPDGRFLYYTANASHPGNYEVFRVAVDGGGRGIDGIEPERLTSLGGVNDYVLSPTGDQLLLMHSTATRPPELWRQEARAGASPVQLTRTVSDQFASLPWVAPEVVEVPSSHTERPIYARLYLPTGDSAATAARPAVIFIHGAGYLQNAHLGWSSYFREFMFHTLLVQHGYVVLDMDYRASAGYGRDWRTAIYRHMGGPEVEDLADGVRYLVEHHGVDPHRVGAYGGSYGGFLTMMAMFQRPELFAAGAALRPVTDWAHYNHPYTANILNTPELDPEAYERSSPIEHAAGLSRPLLICTGMLDDNVFFQDSVRLAQRLIELEKKDWEVAMYPIEPHGFREPASWLDEYRRIFALFERHLKP
ncbi:MAG TPA: prolyl oligopeptidase family serine peptidase [Thermoanaerobaculia bacterium]|nr:prolyl oligopeptidase family serine peptidase [Thermoanaerobaculia bacterium]